MALERRVDYRSAEAKIADLHARQVFPNLRVVEADTRPRRGDVDRRPRAAGSGANIVCGSSSFGPRVIRGNRAIRYRLAGMAMVR